MKLAALVVLCMLAGAIAQSAAPAPGPAQKKLDVEGQTLLITDNVGKLTPTKGYALFYRHAHLHRDCACAGICCIVCMIDNVLCGLIMLLMLRFQPDTSRVETRRASRLP